MRTVSHLYLNISSLFNMNFTTDYTSVTTELPDIIEPIFVILVLVGFVGYGHLFVAIVSPKSFKKLPVYICIFSLGVCDCLALAVLLFYSIPSRLYGTAVGSQRLGNVILAVQEGCWLTSLTSLLLQSFYRFVKICEPPRLNDWIRDELIRFYVIGCWGVGFIGSIPAYFPCCSIDGFTSAFEPQAKDFSTFDLTYSCITFGSSILLNIVTMSHIIRKKKSVKTEIKSDKKKRSDVRLFYQLTCVVTVGLISTLTFNILPNFSEEIWVFYLIDFLNICFYTVDAWVYLILNDTIRSRVVSMYRGKIDAPQTRVTSQTDFRK